MKQLLKGISPIDSLKLPRTLRMPGQPPVVWALQAQGQL